MTLWDPLCQQDNMFVSFLPLPTLLSFMVNWGEDVVSSCAKHTHAVIIVNLAFCSFRSLWLSKLVWTVSSSWKQCEICLFFIADSENTATISHVKKCSEKMTYTKIHNLSFHGLQLLFFSLYWQLRRSVHLWDFPSANRPKCLALLSTINRNWNSSL